MGTLQRSLIIISIVCGGSGLSTQPGLTIYQQNPNEVTLVDTLSCLVLFQNPGVDLTPDQIAAGVSSLLDQSISSATFNPVPSSAGCDFVASLGTGVELTDVIAVLVAFQNPGVSLSAEQLSAGINAILPNSTCSSGVISIPGSPTILPSPTPCPSPTPTATPTPTPTPTPNPSGIAGSYSGTFTITQGEDAGLTRALTMNVNPNGSLTVSATSPSGSLGTIPGVLNSRNGRWLARACGRDANSGDWLEFKLEGEINLAAAPRTSSGSLEERVNGTVNGLGSVQLTQQTIVNANTTTLDYAGNYTGLYTITQGEGTGFSGSLTGTVSQDGSMSGTGSSPSGQFSAGTGLMNLGTGIFFLLNCERQGTIFLSTRFEGALSTTLPVTGTGTFQQVESTGAITRGTFSLTR
ncbi:MAG: hypothetical protein OHK0012_17730 [Synechococcales cyanobacterium]